MLHKSYCLPLILVVAFAGALSLTSCQTSNENTKYLDEEELDLEQVIVDSLRLDKRLKALPTLSELPNTSGDNINDLSLMLHGIPGGLQFLGELKEAYDFEILDNSIEQVHRREGDRITNLLKYYNYYFSTSAQSIYQLAYRISAYSDWHSPPGIDGNGILPRDPDDPRFSRVKYAENVGGDTGTFLINVEYWFSPPHWWFDHENPSESNDLYTRLMAQVLSGKNYLIRYGFGRRKDLPRDIANALYMAKFMPNNTKPSSLVENMVEAGKRLFFLECLLPEWPDHKLIDYSKTSLDWCVDYEYDLWEMFNDPKWACDLNSKSKFLRQKALGLGAGTPNLGWVNLQTAPNAPDRIGEWIGWQIVRAYAAEHGGYRAVEAILETPASEIFRKSPYPPQ